MCQFMCMHFRRRGHGRGFWRFPSVPFIPPVSFSVPEYITLLYFISRFFLSHIDVIVSLMYLADNVLGNGQGSAEVVRVLRASWLG